MVTMPPYRGGDQVTKSKYNLQRFPSKGLGERGIKMDGEISQTEIKDFVTSNGLNTDLLDERDETLEAWRLKWEGLAKGFVNYLQDRFSAIEHRLDRLEDRHRHQMD
jgi:hypothetical protein